MPTRTYTLNDFADEVDINHPLTARRIPVVHTSHPRWQFHVALAINDNGYDNRPEHNGIEPEPFEVRQLIVYLEKTLRWYNDSYRATMLARAPFDIDSGVNTYVFRKNPVHGWQYRAMSWTMGPLWAPSPFDYLSSDPYTLEGLLDRINTFGGPNESPMQSWLDLKEESGAFKKLATASVH